MWKADAWEITSLVKAVLSVTLDIIGGVDRSFVFQFALEFPFSSDNLFITLVPKIEKKYSFSSFEEEIPYKFKKFEIFGFVVLFVSQMGRY